MSEHRATIAWKLGGRSFTYDTYPRDHTWRFPGGVEIPASSAPQFLGSTERVDPEEALVAAVAACHMLTFLAIAARKRLTVERYEDQPSGTLEKNAAGRLAITRVVLRPQVTFADGSAPSPEELARLHEKADEHCFIANSVTSKVVVEAR